MIKILYVDDETGLLELGKIFLELSEDMHVDTARSVSSAMQMIDRTQYDAIISDYQMPMKDGIEFLKSFRASGNTTPFILFTGKGREEVVIEALNSGANFYLQKGGDPQAQYLELEHYIKTAVHQHRADESLRIKNAELQELNKQLAEAEVDLRQHLKEIIRAQEELREEMAFSESLSESLPGIFYVFDAQTLRMVRWNRNHCEVTGFSDDELKDKLILDWFRPEDVEVMRSSIRDCLKNGQALVQVPVILKDGTQMPCLLTGKRFDSAQRTYVVGVGIDMTEREKIEEDLRESVGLFRLITENTTDVVSVLTMDLRYTYVSPSIMNLRGFTVEEAVAQSLDQVLTPESMQLASKMMQEEMESWRMGGGDPSRTHYVELEQYRKDGSTLWVGNNLSFILDKHGMPKAIIAISYDITERKKTGDVLRESEYRFDQLAEHSGVITWEVDESGLFTYVSRVSESVLGLDPEGLVNKAHFYDFISESSDIKANALGIFQAKEKFVDLEIPLHLKDGQQKWMSINGFPLQNPDGTIRGYQGNTVDITERKMAEIELRSLNKKMKLLSSITRHDISNQVLAVTGNLDLFLMKNPHFDNDAHLINARKAFDRITATVDFAMTYDDIGSLEPKWHDIGEVIRAASEQVSDDRVRIINDVPPGVSIYADPLLVNAFFNLIDNAVRYGGKTTNVRFLLDRNDGRDLLICEDDGIGISSDMRSKLFERGFGTGHGLGLFLTREILSITGITIGEEGQPGKGARFVLNVPQHGITDVMGQRPAIR